jgi:tetratricopeptide (TPR) repeat protein
MLRKLTTSVLLCGALNFRAMAEPAALDAAITALGHGWARASYQTPDSEKEAVFRALADRARQLALSYPGRAEALIWQAIILAGAAKAEGGLGALGKVKQARDLLLEAERISPGALHGSASESLGTLYAKVPGWPIGFGDRKKAREYLTLALALDPSGIDANFFYADFLADQGEYASAVAYLTRALNAPARTDREDADAGRRHEAAGLLAMLREKHGGQLAGQ